MKNLKKKPGTDPTNIYGVNITHKFISNSATYPLVYKGKEAFLKYRQVSIYEGILYPYNEEPFLEMYTLGGLMLFACNYEYLRLKRHPCYNMIKDKANYGLLNQAAAFEARKTLRQIETERNAALKAIEEPSRKNVNLLNKIRYHSRLEMNYKTIYERIIKISSPIFADVLKDISNTWTLEKKLQSMLQKSIKKEINFESLFTKKLLKKYPIIEFDYAIKTYYNILPRYIGKEKVIKLEPLRPNSSTEKKDKKIKDDNLDIYMMGIYNLDGRRLVEQVDPDHDPELIKLYKEREKKYNKLNPEMYHNEIRVDPNIAPGRKQVEQHKTYLPYVDKVEDKIDDAARYMRGESGLNVLSQMPAKEMDKIEGNQRKKLFMIDESLLLLKKREKFLLSFNDLFGEEYPTNVKQYVQVDESGKV